MKEVQFIYEETKIDFIKNENDNVMVNATQMASKFNKSTKDFLRLDGVDLYIKELLKKVNNGADVPHYNREDIVYTNKKAGTFMHRKLALKFAAWLNVKFEIWIFDTIDDILFGHYKKHWEAHAKHEQSKIEMDTLKQKMLTNPTVEIVQEYFEAERDMKNAKNAKTRAIKNQLSLFGRHLEDED